MKIGIITDVMDEKGTGTGTYAYNLIKNLLKIDKDNEYLFIHFKRADDEIYKGRDLIIPPLKVPPKKAFRYIQLPLVLKEKNLDIIHSFTLPPFFYSAKPFFSYNSKKIQAITDINSFKIFPQYHKPLNVLLGKIMLLRVLKNADVVITISETSKLDIKKYFKLSEDKIKVTYLGVDIERFKLLKNVKNVKEKYHLNHPFILYVGRISPIKNIPAVIKAFYKFKRKTPDHKLIIVEGKVQKTYKYLILEMVKKLNLQKDVIFVTHVPHEDLPGLYNLADLFVFPSFYEGFGLPPLEAMACGTPVITSNGGALPEIVGDAAIKIDPYNIDELAEMMEEALMNGSLRRKIIKKGLERAKFFSWKKTAQETSKIYEGLN